MKSILVVLSLFFAFNAQAEVLKRTTLSKSSGKAAHAEFLTLETANQAQNALGQVLSESRVKYSEQKSLVNNGGRNGIVSEKLTNCWFTAPSNYACETVLQERQWFADLR